MARTPSTMVPLGSQAPDFSLINARDGRTVTRDEALGAAGLLVMFLCNHCPFVKHVRSALAAFGRDYAPRGLGIVAVSSNDVSAYPADAPELMKLEADEAGYGFPYLFDETQNVAKAYEAACTPDFFLYDRDLRLIYRGQFDETRPSGGKPATGRDLRAAADALLAGRPPVDEQIASIGCNVKWKPGNEPPWFGAGPRLG